MGVIIIVLTCAMRGCLRGFMRDAGDAVVPVGGFAAVLVGDLRGDDLGVDLETRVLSLNIVAAPPRPGLEGDLDDCLGLRSLAGDSLTVYLITDADPLAALAYEAAVLALKAGGGLEAFFCRPTSMPISALRVLDLSAAIAPLSDSAKLTLRFLPPAFPWPSNAVSSSRPSKSTFPPTSVGRVTTLPLLLTLTIPASPSAWPSASQAATSVSRAATAGCAAEARARS